MGHYRVDEDNTPTESQVRAILFNRDDIKRFQDEMLSNIAQMRQNRQECENAMNDLREARYTYELKIRNQDERINELTASIVTLSNKLEKLNGQ